MNKISSSSKIQRLLKESRQYCQSGKLEEAKLIYEDLLKIIRDIETQKVGFGKSIHKEAFTGVDYLGNVVKFSSYVIWQDNNKIYKYNFDENWTPFDNEILRRNREEREK